ncbi:MAG: hypothetical protein ABIZ09_13250 [Rhodoferax sp.]
MSFESEIFRNLLEKEVRISPLVRVFLAVIVIVGGLSFFILGGILLFTRPTVAPPHPVAAKLLSLFLSLMGAGFFWVGSQFIRARAVTSYLFSPRARRHCSLVVGLLAVCMLIAASEFQSIQFFANAIALVAFSYWLFPLADR